MDGGLQIRFNRDLTSLQGLNNLSSVLDTLWIEQNPEMRNLNALASLSSIPTTVIVWDNDKLTDLHGLGGIASIAGDLMIIENNSLTSLSGLGNLVQVGGNLFIGIFVTNFDRTRGGNRGLLSLEGLNQLASVGGTLDIRGNSALLNLSALNLSFLGGTLTVADNGLLDTEVIAALGREIGSWRLCRRGRCGEKRQGIGVLNDLDSTTI